MMPPHSDNYRLERRTLNSGATVGIVARTMCRATGYGPASILSGTKVPVAVLITAEKGVLAFNPAGNPMRLDDVERLLPGVAQHLKSAPAETPEPL